jgi:hypothetical protein
VSESSNYISNCPRGRTINSRFVRLYFHFFRLVEMRNAYGHLVVKGETICKKKKKKND